jgi:hypothetical protein
MLIKKCKMEPENTPLEPADVKTAAIVGLNVSTVLIAGAFLYWLIKR